MYILRDEITSGSYDWLLWLDVDAFIWDHDINLYTEVIEPNKDYAIISAAGWPLPSGYNSDTIIQGDINSGVLFFNLKHEKIKSISDLWIERLEIDANTPDWSGNHPNGCYDQGYLSDVLYYYWQQDSIEYVKIFNDLTNQYNYINYDGSLIKHILGFNRQRTPTELTFEERFIKIENYKNEIWQKYGY